MSHNPDANLSLLLFLDTAASPKALRRAGLTKSGGMTAGCRLTRAQRRRIDKRSAASESAKRISSHR